VFKMCYIHNALDTKTSAERKFVRTIYILIGTMVRKCEQAIVNSSLINSKFFEQRKLAKQLSKVIYKDYYLLLR